MVLRTYPSRQQLPGTRAGGALDATPGRLRVQLDDATAINTHTIMVETGVSDW
jgi:hypothetical protein